MAIKDQEEPSLAGTDQRQDLTRNFLGLPKYPHIHLQDRPLGLSLKNSETLGTVRKRMFSYHKSCGRIQ